jgi:hypothetical protein
LLNCCAAIRYLKFNQVQTFAMGTGGCEINLEELPKSSGNSCSLQSCGREFLGAQLVQQCLFKRPAHFRPLFALDFVFAGGAGDP